MADIELVATDGPNGPAGGNPADEDKAPDGENGTCILFLLPGASPTEGRDGNSGQPGGRGGAGGNGGDTPPLVFEVDEIIGTFEIALKPGNGGRGGRGGNGADGG